MAHQTKTRALAWHFQSACPFILIFPLFFFFFWSASHLSHSLYSDHASLLDTDTTSPFLFIISLGVYSLSVEYQLLHPHTTHILHMLQCPIQRLPCLQGLLPFMIFLSFIAFYLWNCGSVSSPASMTPDVNSLQAGANVLKHFGTYDMSEHSRYQINILFDWMAKNSHHFLRAFYMPRTVLSTSHALSHLTPSKLLGFFGLHHRACGILIPQPGIKPMPSTGKVQSPNHWTARKFPSKLLLCSFYKWGNWYFKAKQLTMMVQLKSSGAGISTSTCQVLEPNPPLLYFPASESKTDISAQTENISEFWWDLIKIVNPSPTVV